MCHDDRLVIPFLYRKFLAPLKLGQYDEFYMWYFATFLKNLYFTQKHKE